MEVGVGVAHEVGVGPRWQQVVLQVVAEQRRRVLGQTIDRGLATLERGPDAGLVLFGRRLAHLGQGFDMLSRLVGPAGGRVPLEVVLPGLAGGVDEVEALEGEGAVEPGLLGRVLQGDGLLRGFEGLRNVRGLVGLGGPREVGRGEVAQQARVLGLLGRSRLEGLDGRGDVSRDEIRDAQGPQGLRRGIALGALADAGDRPQDCG